MEDRQEIVMNESVEIVNEDRPQDRHILESVQEGVLTRGLWKWIKWQR
jgi:hypothetical protein